MDTKCIRLLCVLGSMACLPACAPIVAMIGYSNSAIQVAVQLDRLKLAGDSVSYLGSGKTITDHAVSKMVGADCRLINVVSPDPVCQPKPAATAKAAAARINLAAVDEDMLNAEARFTGLPAAVIDESAMNAVPANGADTTGNQ